MSADFTPEKKDYKVLPPFKMQVLTNFPYIEADFDALTNYQLLCKVVEYLNMVIHNENEVTEEVTGLYNAYVSLQNYVNNYFDNLDVQEEINNKLDEMAESGQLTDIIAQYLGLAGMITYNNVSEMKSAQNLVNGSKCQTLGYTSINDGGGSIYKVRTITNDDVVDEATIIALHDNTLIAELIIEDKLKPVQFGAIGDGTTDDTTAVRNCLKYCINNSKECYIDKKYYIKSSLLTNNDYNSTVNILLKGNCLPYHNYSIDNYGGIKFDSGLNLFDGITISGIISNICFAPTSRTQTGSIFNNCSLSRLRFENNFVCNILAFMNNSSAGAVTKILNNRMLTIYYFGKVTTPNKSFTDSEIAGNYINGGEEMNNNNCFEFTAWGGSSVHDNFIDYYRTIYAPTATSSTKGELPSSVNNQYQVFKYLYFKGTNISSITFNSVNDVFNWNDPTKLTKINNFTPLTYTGHDSQEHEYPPFILMVEPTCLVSIQNAYLQSNLDNIVFIYKPLTQYQYGKSILTCNGNVSFDKYHYPVTHADSLYNGGTYKKNYVNIPFARTLESLPTVSSGWNDYYGGERVYYNNEFYRLIYDTDNSKFDWIIDYSI